MKSTDFIKESQLATESPGQLSNQEWIKIAKLIQRDCRPYLSQNNGASLYRGLEYEDKIFLKKKVRLTNREPKDMPYDIHDKLNQYFFMKHGAKFRNALFLSGDKSQAEDYGKLYKIFPIGKFEFLWSPNVADLFSEWEEFDTGGSWGNDYKSAEEEEAHDKEQLKQFHDTVLASGYTTDHLAMAINSDNEIMLRCSSYYALASNEFNELPTEWQEMVR